jgi:hypothetical protein
MPLPLHFNLQDETVADHDENIEIMTDRFHDIVTALGEDVER